MKIQTILWLVGTLTLLMLLMAGFISRIHLGRFCLMFTLWGNPDDALAPHGAVGIGLAFRVFGRDEYRIDTFHTISYYFLFLKFVFTEW